ncbi:MAG: ATPase [Bacteroidetes bacterium]|jgi:uncharacterized protein YndB with AHSA1/START domain|nr:ATPase [Bacteroidota bacterium]
MAKDRLTKSIRLKTGSSKSFNFFVEHIHLWWPKEYTWSQEVLQKIIIEPYTGGKCYELGPYDLRIDWGRVIEFNKPNTITFTWQISDKREPVPNPAKSSRVQVQFQEQDENNCHLILTHFDFSHHGEGFENYLQAMDSEYGWGYVLQNYQNELERF